MRTGTLEQSVIKLSLIAVLLLIFSGCAINKQLPAPCGASDYIEVPKGGTINNVPLPTDEAGKTYTIVTPKPGFWISLDCDNRIGR